LAALDIALWDWLGKCAGLPLYRLLGLGLPTTPTSVTLGINPPEVVRERIPLLLDNTGIRSLKVKLGSPEGIEADKAMFAAVIEATRKRELLLRVDANGGWSLEEAREMMTWLASREVEYIEQPLQEGEEHLLPALFKDRNCQSMLMSPAVLLRIFQNGLMSWMGSISS
jgi:muconate cycloisomerase